MRARTLFTKTRKEAPKDEVSKSARLLIQAGFIDKLQAGVYTYLPLGLRVLKNIERIIREEMDALGANEILMPSLHPKENWETTGRWATMDDLYKVKDSSGRENALGGTHEEVISPLMKQFISSYRDLPRAVYQIQNKFRMELRAKSGILRGREFIMKDLYSFHATEDDLVDFYERVKNAYLSIFSRAGIGEMTRLTFASGGSFSRYSHEFQTVTEAGEDLIYICRKCKTAINKEIKAEHAECPSCDGDSFTEEKSIEVGNIFSLKTKFSEPFGLSFKNEKGGSTPVLMGCYGIGLGRLMGAVAEVLSDDAGLVWPKELAPFDYHLIALGPESGKVFKNAEALYEKLSSAGVRVFFDDREVSAGEKFADADLIGIPTRIVASEKTAREEKFEVKERTAEETRLVGESELIPR